SAPAKPEPAKTSEPPLRQNNFAPRIQATPAPPRQEKAPASKSPKTSGFSCPFCRQSISALATTCSRCHLPLAMNCPACGAATDIEQPACAECGQVLGNYRRGVTYFAGLAAAYQENKRAEDALKAWQAVEILKPAYPQLQLRLGEAQLGVGRPDRAMLNFEHALEEDPDSAQVHFALADLWRQRGESQKAFTHLLRVTQLDPQHGLAWLRLGQLYERARRQQEANQAYRRAAALLAEDSAESRQALQQLAQLQPGLPEAMATGWGELLRQMTGPVFICVLAALLDAGLRPWWIPWTGWLALFLAVAGAFLWISGTSLPRNPLIRGLLGEGWVSSAALRLPVAILGVGCWLLAFGIILLPLAGQSFPEPPTL
ncbi:MAG TPA: tetratricopeptide repeat protein, partial [Anaerolineae bacterium]|nr:tetratricopeptide repeat protein [Anaerolineae bacterium]